VQKEEIKKPLEEKKVEGKIKEKPEEKVKIKIKKKEEPVI
jgi:hypothetical protein